jgi:Mitochondrial branched-chain alpha-ketoacid dehydrogenase kinase
MKQTRPVTFVAYRDSDWLSHTSRDAVLYLRLDGRQNQASPPRACLYMGLLGIFTRRQILLTLPRSVGHCLPLRHYLHTEQLTEDSSELSLLLTKYSQQQPRPLTLKKLLSFGSPLNQESLVESAGYVLSEIPRRLVGRVRALEALPFIVTTNPFLSRTLRAYRSSFEALATHPPVTTLQENWEFTQRLEGLVADHANDIPTMAKGYSTLTWSGSRTQFLTLSKLSGVRQIHLICRYLQLFGPGNPHPNRRASYCRTAYCLVQSTARISIGQTARCWSGGHVMFPCTNGQNVLQIRYRPV